MEHDTVDIELELAEASRNKTAQKAARILIERKQGFVVPTASQKRNLLVEFARRNKVIYGKAFDIIRVPIDIVIDLDSDEDVRANLDHITIFEIKSTNKKAVGHEFKSYFFGLTAAELLVAQNLKDQYKFVFVNVNSKEVLELSLTEVFTRATGIYPTWSVRF